MEKYIIFRSNAEDELEHAGIVEAESEKQAIKRYMATEGKQLVPVETDGEGIGIEAREGVPFDAELHWASEGEEAVRFSNDFVVVKISELTGYISV